MCISRLQTHLAYTVRGSSAARRQSIAPPVKQITAGANPQSRSDALHIIACSAIDHVHPVSRTASDGQSAADVLGWHGWKDRGAMSLTEDDHGDVDRT